MNLMRIWIAVIVFAGSVTAPEKSAVGQEKSSWWNPFSASSKEGKVIESSYFNQPKKSSWTMPKLSMPKLSWSSDSQKKSNSAFSQMSSSTKKLGSSTKKLWSNTVDWMNPFDDSSPKSKGYRPQKTKSSGSGPFGWMWQEEKMETPATVNDFLRQPNPLLEE